ncbi:hypothetical protein C9J20_13685 [Photobacterium phosphoreum]|jgi:hypothetical protein|uniref:hypothetical protein n=1 Tax=Photobacterium phosphoreum TaxID=659 RepID=UPI000D15426A|nr:hypothetical protein [Photobacterium phosphoreum]PSU66567.1 hypothetical protein CTM79_18920 [Photobacterium phosphoreum]PSW10706.1 hypothetical protein C9J20_13685 [Photobacterium phosphoreum]
MKNIFNQVSPQEADALEKFLAIGKHRILHNREFCGLSVSDFVTFYFEVHDGKLANAMVKFLITADCSSSNTLLTLMGFKEFAKDVFEEFFNENEATILKTFRIEYKEQKEEVEVALAGL